MSDAAQLDAWTPTFEAWRTDAIALMKEGKGPEAFATYPWYETEGDPFTRLAKPASETRFGLITTGGYSIDGEQEPMRPIPNLGGDEPEIREIPADVDQGKLVIHHPGYDHRFAKEDVNVNLPLDRLREMVDAGEIGSFAPTTHVLMGLIPHVAPQLQTTIPHLLERLRSEGAEAALLVPS